MLAMLLPATFLAYTYVDSVTTELNTAQSVLAGARNLAAVTKVLNPISRHRGQTGVYLSGETSFRENALASQAEADAAIEDLDRIDAQYAPQLGVGGVWAPIKKEWQGLKERALTLPSPAETYAQHSALMNDINTLIDRVTESSGIILDLVVVSYLLLDVAFAKGFRALSNLVGLRGRATTASAHGTADATELADMLMLKDNIPDDVQQLGSGLEKAWAASDTSKAATQPRYEELSVSAAAFSRLIYAQML